MFIKAHRGKVWLKLALTGPSGSGKTLSSLRLALGMATDPAKIALVDTENGSAALYADFADPAGSFRIPAFATQMLTAPYTVEKWERAIEEAVSGGYEVLILDSISPEWAGAGGLLEQKDALDARASFDPRAKNQFSNWGPITAMHERFKAAIVESPIHVIATMRSKQDYVLLEGGRVQKLGFAPVQRDGMDYEFRVVWAVGMDHKAHVDKNHTGLEFPSGTITEGHGRILSEWREGAPEATAAPAPASASTPVIRAGVSAAVSTNGTHGGAKLSADRQALSDLLLGMEQARRTEYLTMLRSETGNRNILKAAAEDVAWLTTMIRNDADRGVLAHA